MSFAGYNLPSREGEYGALSQIKNVPAMLVNEHQPNSSGDLILDARFSWIVHVEMILTAVWLGRYPRRPEMTGRIAFDYGAATRGM